MMMTKSLFGQSPNSIRMSGIVKDAESKKPLVAEITIAYKNGPSSPTVVSTQVDGTFDLSVLPKVQLWKIKVKDYIVSNISINASDLNEPNVVCEILLVRQQQQQIDQIYLQSTTSQGHTIEDNKQSKNSTTHTFEAVDGIDRKPISANFKLIFTQDNKISEYSTSSEKPSFKVVFTQKDIIAIEVKAAEYQKFLGNLIIESLDNKTHPNSAKLIRSYSFLNFVSKNSTTLTGIELSEINENNLLKIPVSKMGDIHYALLNITHKYRLDLKQKDSTFKTIEFIAKEGVNQIVFNEPPPIIVIEPSNDVLYFEQSTVTLKSESKQKLDAIVEKMKQSPQLKIDITGHTDNIGSYHQNEYLAEFRAKYVANYLFNKGINNERIKVKGDGSTKPIKENDTEENRSLNRRVEIKLY